MAAPTSLDIGHPAPARHAAHPLALLFALLGGPAGWLGQLLFSFAATSVVCRAGLPPPVWITAALIACNLLGLALAGAALATALMLLRRTAHEHRSRHGGLLDAGEGRTRFLAVWGSLISAAFIVATLANSLSLGLVPLCKV